MRSERVALALRMVARRPLRSSLAAVGLALALAALLVATAIAERARKQALAEIGEIGADVLTISAQPTRNQGARVRTGGVVTRLTRADGRDIATQVAGVSALAAEYRAEALVKVGDLARQARVAGVEPVYGILRGGAVAGGRFIDEFDDAQSRRVAVIGGWIAKDLFPGRDPVGETFRIRGVPFAVVGVLDERGSGLDPFNEDEVIFVPLRVAQRRIFQVDYVQRFFARLDEDRLQEGAAAITALLAARHRSSGPNPPVFRVQDQRRLVEVRDEGAARLRAFQREIAAVLLLASALGVFALQLLSVRERRAEIGTRRSLGATRGDIFAQFVIEAGVVCLAGGLGGVGMAWAATAGAGVPLSPGFAMAAFFAAVVAGIVAGAAPARSAAVLHPAAALRGQ
jgi:putative ABC transport system permease protein